MPTTYQVNAAGTTAGEDQTAQELKNATVSLNPAETFLKFGAETDVQFLAFRWVSVALPVKAKILKVKLEVWIPAGTPNTAAKASAAFFYKEPKGCAPFKAVAKNLSERAAIKKSAAFGETATAGAWFVNETAALKEALETLVGEAGWESGNAIGVFIETGTTTKLSIEDFAGTAAHGAKLTIEYEGEGGGPAGKGSPVITLAVQVSAHGSKGAKATPVVTVGIPVATSASKGAKGFPSIGLGLQATARGFRSLVGSPSISLGISSTAKGFKGAIGNASVLAGILVNAIGKRPSFGRPSISLGLGVSAQGKKGATGTATINAGLTPTARGFKGALGSAIVRLAGVVSGIGRAGSSRRGLVLYAVVTPAPIPAVVSVPAQVPSQITTPAQVPAIVTSPSTIHSTTQVE